MAKLYKVELVRGYPQDEHHRAGLLLRRGGTLVTELSKDQLEALKNDHYVSVTEAKDGEQSQAAPLPEDQGAGVTTNATVGPDAPDRSASEDTQTDEDLDAGEEEATDGPGAGAPAADIEGAEGTEPVSGEAGSEPTREGDEAASDDAGEAEGEESGEEAPATDEAAQASQNDAQEEEVTADTLVRDHSREELNAIAIKEGVSNAAELDNKQQVATAIMKIRAAAGN